MPPPMKMSAFFQQAMTPLSETEPPVFNAVGRSGVPGCWTGDSSRENETASSRGQLFQRQYRRRRLTR